MSWKAEKAVDAEGIINCLGHGKEVSFSLLLLNELSLLLYFVADLPSSPSSRLFSGPVVLVREHSLASASPG